MSLYPEQIGDSVKDCVTNLFQLVNASMTSSLNLSGKIIAVDRGYNGRSLINFLFEHGANTPSLEKAPLMEY